MFQKPGPTNLSDAVRKFFAGCAENDLEKVDKNALVNKVRTCFPNASVGTILRTKCEMRHALRTRRLPFTPQGVRDLMSAISSRTRRRYNASAANGETLNGLASPAKHSWDFKSLNDINYHLVGLFSMCYGDKKTVMGFVENFWQARQQF